MLLSVIATIQRQVISTIYLSIYLSICVGILVTCSKMCIVAGLTTPGDMLSQQGQHGYGPQQARRVRRLCTHYFLQMHANQKTVNIPKAGVQMVRDKGVYLLRPACNVAVSPPPRQCVCNAYPATSTGCKRLPCMDVGMVNPGVSELV